MISVDINNIIDFNTSFLQEKERQHWRRILLLIVAITVHNIPEGLTIFFGVVKDIHSQYSRAIPKKDFLDL